MESTWIIKTGTQQTDVVLIQQNVDGSAAFNRSWNEFKVGFGNVTTNFWIGNDCLNQLTRYGAYRVKIEILSTANLTYWLWAEYDRFIVGNELTGYQLQISGYSGIAGDALNGAGASYVANGMKFTTYDRKNDFNPTVNCAVRTWAGFWYNSCTAAHINTMHGAPSGCKWNPEPAIAYPLKSTRMTLFCP